MSAERDEDQAIVDQAVSGLAAYLEARASCKHCLDMGGTFRRLEHRVAPLIEPCPHCERGKWLDSELKAIGYHFTGASAPAEKPPV